jgi:hypothetical protein
MMHPIRAEQICAFVAEQEIGCASRTSNMIVSAGIAFYAALPGSKIVLQPTQPFQAGLNTAALRADAFASR